MTKHKSDKSIRRRMFRVIRESAEKMARDPEQTLSVVDKAWSKAQKRASALDRLRDDFFILMRMVKASVSGKYDRVPWTSLVSALAAIIYFLSPIDAIPDFVVGLGLIDDATVVSLTIAALRLDIDKFRKWEKSPEGEEAIFAVREGDGDGAKV